MKKIGIIFIVLIVILIGLFIIKDDILKVLYPIKYENYVEKYSKEYDVDLYLIYAIIKTESNFDEKAQSKKGANGLMQLMQTTAMETAKTIDTDVDEKSILNPDINIKIGTKYISKLIQKYNNLELAVAAYNAGSGKVDLWISEGTLKADGSDIEKIPFKETNNYVRKVLKNYETYKKLYMNKGQ